MDYAKIAKEVIVNVGGKENILSVTHCATRLRFQLRDNTLRNEDVLSDIEGVKGVFLSKTQFQIIFGSGLVNLVCDEVNKQLGNSIQVNEEDIKEEGNILQRAVKMLSDIFVPIIPAIVAGGLLMGLNNVLTSAMFNGQSIIDLYPKWQGLASAINMFANAPFTFLPVLIGFSATKRFGGNPYLGAAMGMIMVHPDLLNAYSIGVIEPDYWNIIGFNIAKIGYQGTVLPVLAVSFILANIEKRLHKVTPTWLDNLTTPMLSIIITAFLTFTFVGPVLREAGNLLAAGITWCYSTLGFIGGGLFGLFYAPICLTGMHHSFIAIETQLLADIAHTGGSFIFTTASMNNVAQGAAVLAVLFLTKNDKMKSICSASGVSAVLGITEPAMFGVTLNLKYPFYAAMAGSAVGSAYCAATKVLAQAMGAAGIPGIISMRPEDYVNFIVGLVLSMAVSAVLTVFFFKKYDLDNLNKKSEKKTATEVLPVNIVTQELTSVMSGEVKDIKEADDEMFSSGCMGHGVVCSPEDKNVYAPCDCRVKMIFPTKHAIGLETEDGVEILIHMGIDTVNLKGEGFEVLVKENDSVKKGDVIAQMNLELIREKGYSVQTMTVVTKAEGRIVQTVPCQSADNNSVVIRIEED